MIALAIIVVAVVALALIIGGCWDARRDHDTDGRDKRW